MMHRDDYDLLEAQKNLDYEWSPIFLSDSGASETRARVKIIPREKKATRGGEREKCRVSPFLAWGDFHARSRFARPTIPEEKWGTTRSLRKTFTGEKCLIGRYKTT